MLLCHQVDSRVLRLWCCNFLTDSILVVNSLTLTKLVLTATFSLLVNKYSHIFSHLGLKPALYELFFQYAIPLCLSNIFRATEVGTEVQAKICSYDRTVTVFHHPHLSGVPDGGGGGDDLVDLLDEDDHHDSRVCFICWRGERQVRGVLWCQVN